ncbi:acyl-CoA thioester hydrolase/BAAT C-terminal domain-containing protein [Algimonas porphyrae]|nr:acyl-CoA thioester hydrolase/BAAT C-terminal domain-containing protein [Algimonas porphyrae]
MTFYRTLLLATALITTASCQTLTPSEPAMTVADRLTWADAPVLVMTGLEPGQAYTLKTERRSGWNDQATERSSLRYVADAKGRIDTSVSVPDGLTDASAYTPIQRMDYLSDQTLNDLDPYQLRFRLVDADGGPVLQRVVEIGPDRDALVETALGDDFPGAYVLTSVNHEGPRPTIVILGGSEGGDSGSRYTAPTLAAEGFTVLGLPYYSPAWGGQEQQFPGLPRAFANIAVDYLEEAVTQLRQRPDVDPDRITLHGGSKGAEFVLLAGSLIADDSPGGGFCGIVADVPSDVVWEGWGAGETVSSFSWRGEPLPFVPYQDMSRALDRSDPYTMTEAHENGRTANPDRVEPARIRVETIDEPVLLIGGDVDTTWASGAMSRRIKAFRDAAGLQTDMYVYKDAGHGVGGTPLVRTSVANLAARLENFPALIRFHKQQSERPDCRE